MTSTLITRRNKSDEGFTLIEMLIVIIILGVLAAVVVFSVRGINDRGQNSACKASKTALSTGLEAFFAKTGDYPADLNLLKPDFVSDFGGDLTSVALPAPHQELKPNNTNSTWKLEYTFTAASGGVAATYTLLPPVGTTGC
jgi:prepilin-type N-terminal cleavage/methylation domain-containing protein